MSKKTPKGFSPASKQPSNVPKAADPDIKTKTIKNDALSKEAQEKVVGGSSGPGYNFTGVAPGSKAIERWCHRGGKV